MTSNLTLHIEQIKAEFEVNKRLQLISIAALVLFILWFHVQLNNWRIAAQQQALANLASYQDTLVVASENVWVDRAGEANTYLQAQRSKLWVASSEGEAEAKLRDWLQQQAESVGLEITRITVEVGVAPRAIDLRPVHVDIQGVYTAGAWQLLLQSITTNAPPVTVDMEQLNVVNKKNLFYRLNLTAWFTINAPAEGK